MILDDIVAWKRQEVERRRAAVPTADLEKRVSPAARRRFVSSLSREGRLSILAEIKRASPSAGRISDAADPAALARTMETAGANALSVLTDKRYFDGSLEDLANARQAVSIPVLQKDFIIDEYQLFEAAAWGADAVLLIVRILQQEKLETLYRTAGRLSLDCLVEVHSRADLQRALALDPSLIGINNRDLSTFTVDIGTTLALMPLVPSAVKVVSQSGISDAGEARRLFEAGVSAIQVGESIMRAEDPAAKIRELLGSVD